MLTLLEKGSELLAWRTNQEGKVMSTSHGAVRRSVPQYQSDRRFVSPRNPRGYCKPGLITQRLGEKESRAWLICPWCLREQETQDDGRPLAEQFQDLIDANMLAHRQCWLDHGLKVHDRECSNLHNDPHRTPCKCFDRRPIQ